MTTINKYFLRIFSGLAVLTFLLTIAKIVGMNIPWLVVFCPFWLPIASVFTILVALAIIASLLVPVLSGIFVCVMFISLIVAIFDQDKSTTYRL